MQESSWWMDILRMFLYGLDQIVYGLIETLYNLFIYISDLTIFNSGDFLKFTNKVYLILGIIMLFKVAFSLISLFANPDNLLDAQKGITNIVKRIIIALIVITFIPTVFQTAYRIQAIVINDNIIGNFFLGDIARGGNSNKEVTVDKIQKNAGKMIAFNILSAFYYPEDFMLKYDPDGKLATTGEDENKAYVFGISDSDFSSPACRREIVNGELKDTYCNGKLYYKIVNETYSIYDYGAFIKKDNNRTDIYLMRYMWIFSTIAGVAVAWIFLGFCFDVAIRAVKLSVLQLIAPIPIFSYIDPKKGESIFKNWYTTCLSTYFSLFMRLILIYLVIYICYILSDHGIQQFNAEGVAVNMAPGNGFAGIAKALMYFGVLWFAKSAPKLFSDMFGIKGDSSSFGTTIARMGIAGTGLAVGVGGAKYLGSKYRRGLQKSKNRGEMYEMREKLAKSDRSEFTAEEQAKYDDLKYQNKWSQGFKPNFNAFRYGAAAGFAGGMGAKKVSMSGLKQGVAKANNTEKVRNKGVSFYKQMTEKLNTFSGVPNKYGEFGEYKGELDALTDKRQSAQKMENRLNEIYTEQFSNLSNEYDGKDIKRLDDLFRNMDDEKDPKILAEKIEGLKTKIAEDYAMKKNPKNKKLRNDEIAKVRQKLEDLNTAYNIFNESDIRGKKLDTKIKDVQAKLAATGEAKK